MPKKIKTSLVDDKFYPTGQLIMQSDHDILTAGKGRKSQNTKCAISFFLLHSKNQTDVNSGQLQS